MFLQECVCPHGGRVYDSVHAGMPDPPWTRQTPPDQADLPRTRQTPWTRQTPRKQADPPDQADPPWGSRLQHTVYERPVRILLKCILVIIFLIKVLDIMIPISFDKIHDIMWNLRRDCFSYFVCTCQIIYSFVKWSWNFLCGVFG